jgi:hypothetical protein
VDRAGGGASLEALVLAWQALAFQRRATNRLYTGRPFCCFRARLALVVRFTNNVVVVLFLFPRQQKLLKSAATHVLASPACPVE